MPSQQTPEAIEDAAKAAVAAARAAHDRGRHHPADAAASRPCSRSSRPAAAEPPPAAERRSSRRRRSAVNRPRRMPGIDELPRAGARTSCAPSAASERRPSIRRSAGCGLLRRLAAVGLGRREDEEEPERRPASRPADAAATRPQRPADRPTDRAAPPRPAMPRPPALAGRSRSRNMPSARPTRGSIPWDGRRLCTIPRRGPTRHSGLPAPAGELTACGSEASRGGVAAIPVDRDRWPGARAVQPLTLNI